MSTLLTIGSVLPHGQGWQQIGELALAFVLSSLIGLEREWRQASAGLRTHAMVGTENLTGTTSDHGALPRS